MVRSGSFRWGVIAALAAFLSGCSGVQSGTVTPVTSAQSRMHRGSASSGDLIYVTATKDVVVMSYPEGKVVATIPWHTPGDSICSDTEGNVFLPQGSGSSDSHVYEYAHGSTTPIATLDLPTGYVEPDGCAVDPLTGNLAVNAEYGPQNHGALLVYPNEKGPAAVYTDKKVRFFKYPAYDGSGNLYSMAESERPRYRLIELPFGKHDYKFLTFTNCDCTPSKMEWDGTYLTYEDTGSNGGGLFIDQIEVSGKAATLVGSTQFLDGSTTNLYGFVIQDGLLFAKLQKVLQNNNQGVGVWSYASGGNPIAKFHGFTKGRKDFLADLTVSVAPSATHIRK